MHLVVLASFDSVVWRYKFRDHLLPSKEHVSMCDLGGVTNSGTCAVLDRSWFSNSV